MNWIRNKKMAFKIGAFVGLMSAFLALIGIVDFIFFERAGNFIENFYSNNLISVQTINQARSDSNALKSAVLALTSFPLDDAAKKTQLNQIETRENSIAKFIKDIAPLVTTEYESERLTKIKSEFQTIKDINQKTINYAKAGNNAEAQNYYLNNGFSRQDNFQVLLREMGNFNIDKAKNLASNEKNTIYCVKMIFLIFPIIIIIAAIVIGIIMTRMITVPVNEVVTDLKEVADGNLTVENLKYNFKDEIGALTNSLNTMITNVKDLIRQVANSAEHLASSSEELTASAEQQALATNHVAEAIQKVAGGAEKQSNAIDETSSAMEQMAAAVQEVAANGSEVAEKANKMSVGANEGQKVVGKAVSQMERIGQVTGEVQTAIDQLEQGSKKIGEITNVISDIATQTNLLALNAAIEAARAGEQGRGFAVVAEEVRKLAEQSQEAAEQITSLINDNQLKINNVVQAMEAEMTDVKDGIEVVTSAGQTFKQMADAINQVVNRIQAVSTTTEEMAKSSQLIASSIEQIDRISKENMSQSQSVSAATEEQTASSEQIASASQSLAVMAQDLQALVNKFQI